MSKEVTNKVVDPNVLDFGATMGANVERRLNFKPRASLGNLCQGFLIKAEVLLVTAPEIVEKTGLPSTWEYAGLDIPNLVLTFEQAPTTDDIAQRFYEHRFQPFTIVKKDGSKADVKDVHDFYKEEYTKLRHILNAFITNANFAEVAIPAFNPFLEDPIARLAEIKTWYQAFVTMLNGKDGKGFPKQLNNMKLVASREGTYLTFPSFTGQGFIEKFVNGKKSTLELKPSESVVLVSKKEGTKPKNTSTEGGEEELSPEIQAAIGRYTNK